MCVGLDTHKAKIAVAVAEPGRAGEVRFHGEIANQPDAVRRLIERLGAKHGRLRVCYEAGPCGYGLQRQITGSRPRLHGGGALAGAGAGGRPGQDQPARRGHAGPAASRRRADRGVGARSGARGDARPGPGAHGRDGDGAPGAPAAPGLPLAPRSGVHRPQGLVAGAPALAGRAPLRAPAQQIVLQEQIDAIAEAERRRDRLGEQIRELVPDWSMAPVVTALQAMRGIAFLSAVVLVAEVGDFRRFANPRQLMAWLGLVPSEHSSGSKVERGGITKAGNGRARRVLVEGAWSYRFPARVTSPIQARLDGVSDAVRS